MAKKKNSSNDTRGMNSKGQTVTYKGQKVKFPSAVSAPRTEAITAKGQKATGLAKSTKKDRFKLTGQTPVKKGDTAFGGSGGPLGSQGFLKTTPKRVAGAAAVVAGGAAASTVKLGTKFVVSEATKKLQRELSQELKTRSNKDIKNLPKSQREEIAYGRAMQRETPGEYYEHQAVPQQLRENIAKSMKETTKKKKTVTTQKMGSVPKRGRGGPAKKK